MDEPFSERKITRREAWAMAANEKRKYAGLVLRKTLAFAYVIGVAAGLVWTVFTGETEVLARSIADVTEYVFIYLMYVLWIRE